METCEMLHCCGFFKKYENLNHIDCRGFINSYCKGNKRDLCARLDFFYKYDKLPPDDMTPSGKMIDCSKSYVPYNQDSQQFF